MLWLVASAVFAAAPVYTEVSGQVGLEFAQDPGALEERMYGGGAVLDANRDGWPDVYLLGGGGVRDALFLNTGSGRFTRAAAAPIEDPHWGGGVAVGDFDDDGWPDLFVTSRGDASADPVTDGHRLLRNLGDGTFEEVYGGVEATNLAEPDGFGAAFADLDLDGDLDLMVTGWMKGDRGNRVFHNDGAGGFTDVSEAFGLVPGEVRGFLPVAEHLDCDPWPEVLWAADFGTSIYYRANGDGTVRAPVPQPPRLDDLNLMGVAAADLDGDLDVDLFLTGISTDGPGDGNALLLNQRDHRYFDAASVAGLDDSGWAWGVVPTDVDNDGRLDLFVASGWFREPFTEGPSYLFHNQGEVRWAEVGADAGLGEPYDGRTPLLIDFDRDGDEDVLLIGYAEPVRLYRNDTAGGHWLRVRLDTSGVPGLAPDGFGARVLATTATGTLLRTVHGNPSFLGTSEPVAHFGLGDADLVDRLEVWWPNGARTVVEDVAADQELVLAADPDDPPFDPCALEIAGREPMEPVGCGCSGVPGGGAWWVVLVLVGLRRV